MADNVSLNRGSGGKKLKTQEIDGAHVPVMKLADGTANSDTVIEAGNGLAANALRVTLASNSQGQLILLDGENVIGEVEIGGAGWDSGDLAKRFNEPAQSGDVSVAGLVRRTATPANQSGTDGDYEWPQVSDGRAWASLIGDAAHDAAVTGKPVLIGVEGRSVDGSDSGEVAEGDVTRVKGDRAGRAFITTAHPRGFHSSVDYGATAQTNATVQAAPGAGLSLFITDITIRNGPTLANNVTLLNGSGGSVAFECYLGVNQGLTTNLRQPIQLDANTLLAVTSSANSELSITVDGYIAATGAFVFDWSYASIAVAEASGDPWIDGDTINIGGVEFLYLSNAEQNGHSGLIHRTPYNTAAVVSAFTYVDGISGDPDTSTWTDAGTGTKGVDYDHDTNSGKSRLRKLTTTGRALMRQDSGGSEHTESVVIARGIEANTSTGTVSCLLYAQAYKDASNDSRIIVEASGASGVSTTNWLIRYDNPLNAGDDTGLSFAAARDLFMYVKDGNWSLWNGVTLIASGTNDNETTGNTLKSLITSGTGGVAGDCNVLFSSLVNGRMTTA